MLPCLESAARLGHSRGGAREGSERLSGKKTQRRNAIAIGLSVALHIICAVFVINEQVTPYALPQPQPAPLQVEIFPQEEIPPPPPPPVVIPPKIKQALEKQTPPPPPPAILTPPKPQLQPPTPVAPPKPAPPKPSPPTPAPPTPPAPTTARPAPPKPNAVPAGQAPAKSPAPPSPSPSPSPTPSPRPAPSVAVIAPSAVTARTPSPQVVMRPSKLNLHKTNHEVPANVPTLPLSPPGGGAPAGGGGGGGAPGGAPGALTGSRLNGLSPYPYGALPSGGPGLRGTLVGCANAEAVSLSAVERARCNERFGDEAAKAPVLDGIDPAKRARFDKAADKQERDREATMPVGTTPGVQGLGGLGGSPH